MLQNKTQTRQTEGICLNDDFEIKSKIYSFALYFEACLAFLRCRRPFSEFVFFFSILNFWLVMVFEISRLKQFTNNISIDCYSHSCRQSYWSQSYCYNHSGLVLSYMLEICNTAYSE